MACYYAVRPFSVPQDGWQAITCPIMSATIRIRNLGIFTVYLRTREDPSAQIPIPSGTEHVIASNVVTWEPGVSVCELNCPSANSSVSVTFTR